MWHEVLNKSINEKEETNLPWRRTSKISYRNSTLKDVQFNSLLLKHKLYTFFQWWQNRKEVGRENCFTVRNLGRPEGQGSWLTPCTVWWDDTLPLWLLSKKTEAQFNHMNCHTDPSRVSAYLLSEFSNLLISLKIRTSEKQSRGA